MVNLARAEEPLGDPILSDDELTYLVDAYEVSGFTGGINWYRNVDRNWHLLAEVDPIIHQPALMIYGSRDLVPQNERIAEFVPNVDVVELDCGHWIADELPDETNAVILDWLATSNTIAFPTLTFGHRAERRLPHSAAWPGGHRRHRTSPAATAPASRRAAPNDQSRP